MNLSDLMWYVSINGGTSVKHPLRCGVYQTLKGNSIQAIISMLMSHTSICSSSQLYLVIEIYLCLTWRAVSMKVITGCWLITLDLNRDKTELLTISTNCEETIHSSQKTRNIGVLLDSHFCSNEHVANI
ncbi:hypothetical protein pdam_00022985, partial [Pocillopora damicornis]